ncbi:MAG: family 78 glycoside hydrolase catalytic domain [Promethearchaeia archaeon]
MNEVCKVIPTRLRCEYLKNPLGIDVEHPRLSWILENDLQGVIQSAYRILVASTKSLLVKNEGDLWDTDKVNSDQSVHIEYQGKSLSSERVCYWKVMVWDQHGNSSRWSSPSFWSMGILKEDEWKAKWIGEEPRRRAILLRKWFFHDYDPSPYLRKSFILREKPERATVYTTALGEYELHVNGTKIGGRLLAPEWTDYHQRIQYQTYDLTEALQKGENVLGFILGDGWFKGNLGPVGLLHNYYGVNRRCILQLRVIYPDGTSKLIISNEEWKKYEDGSIRKSDHFKGEIYEEKKAVPNWDQSQFNDSRWKKVKIYEKPQGTLVAQMNEPIRIVKEITPVRVTELKEGIFIFDMGQNFTGWCKIHINPSIIEPNSKIILRHGERLYDNGSLYTANLGLAKNKDVYHLKTNKPRTLHPHFTYRGFRYVEVTGLKDGIEPPLELLTGCAIASDCKKAHIFDSSNEKLNRLMKNILWTQRNNMISIPTDCPQRGERMGWMGDTTVYAQSSMLMMDMAAFYTKWIKDIRDAQDELGRYPDFVPYPRNKVYDLLHFYCAPAWADCGVILPWLMYLNYADKRILEIHYQSAKRFIDHIWEVNPDLIWTNSIGHNYADWLHGDTLKLEDYPDEGATIPRDIFATAFFAYSTKLLSKMAAILGKESVASKYSELAKEIRTTFFNEFFTEDLKIKGDTQSGYALALHFDLIPEKSRKRVTKHLIKAIRKYDNRLSTGFLATIPLMTVLIQEGYQDLAYELFLSERCPSWLFMVNQGATTIWERWDGYKKDRGVHSKRMNSFNHFAFGAIAEWIYRFVLGIKFYEENPGYKHFLIEPHFSGKLKWVKGGYESIHGKICVEWEVTEDSINLLVLIPANTKATIFIPKQAKTEIREGNMPVHQSEKISRVEEEKSKVKIDVPPGRYEFLIKDIRV